MKKEPVFSNGLLICMIEQNVFGIDQTDKNHNDLISNLEINHENQQNGN